MAQVDFDYPDSIIEKKIIEQAGGKLKSANLTDPQKIIEFAKGADAIIVQYSQITREILKSLPKVKVVSRYGIGIDNIDVNAARELGVYVAHNPVYCIDEVSDHALAMIMTLQRQIAFGTNQVKEGIWDFSKLTPVKASRDTVIGIIGFGNIGKRIAKKLKIIGFQCIAYDPYIEKEVFFKNGVQNVSLNDLMEQSDCVTIHCSLTNETKNMINYDLLKRMKPAAYIVNTSRGPIIDMEALFRALRKNDIRAAALDVLPEEPPETIESLRDIPSLLLTPHLAFYSETSIIELRSSIAEQVVQVMRNEKPKYNAY